MLISVINQTNGRERVTDERVQEVIRAVNRQLAGDFEPYWGMGATLRLEGRASRQSRRASDMRGDAILYLLTSVEDADGTLGFHERSNRGIPYGFVYTEVSEDLGEPWSATFSHEVMELIADPEANLLAMGPHPADRRRTVFHWLEMCDAVQAQKYEIDGVAVSNFVLPLYFTGGRGPDEPGSRNNFLGTPLQSFGIAEGGYVGFYDPKKQKHDTVFADDVARARAKARSKARLTRRGLRYQRFDNRPPRAVGPQRLHP